MAYLKPPPKQHLIFTRLKKKLKHCFCIVVLSILRRLKINVTLYSFHLHSCKHDSKFTQIAIKNLQTQINKLQENKHLKSILDVYFPVS